VQAKDELWWISIESSQSCVVCCNYPDTNMWKPARGRCHYIKTSYRCSQHPTLPEYAVCTNK
jgi:hypothetical protein